jgi:hypothetical protein
MSEFPGNPLNDPAALWVAAPEGPVDDVPPYGWVWSAMPPAERREKMRELAGWVDWLIAVHELKNTIPACWYRHTKVLEHLTALYAGWVRTYCRGEDSGRDLAEAEWLSTLHTMEPYVKVPACATRHVPPPEPLPESEDRARVLEEYLLTSSFGTAPAQHPVPGETLRLSLPEPPL